MALLGKCSPYTPLNHVNKKKIQVITLNGCWHDQIILLLPATSNMIRTLVGTNIFYIKDVVGAMPIGAVPTTCTSSISI